MDYIAEEIGKSLTDATEEQVEKFAIQVGRLGKFETFFEKYEDEREQFEDLLARAKKALDFKKPYRVAVIGTIGAGKSTLINALLGRPLVLTKNLSKPATGTALEIFLDSESGAEKAVVTYRSGRDIGNLIKEFLERYQLDGSSLKGKLDANFASALLTLNPSGKFSSQQQQSEFINLRKMLANMVLQHANNAGKSPKTEFWLDRSSDVKDLMELIDEHSSLNAEGSPSRAIGLVKKVSYSIQPNSSFAASESLQLPGNVCLVDLPGLDGSPLHDLIISEGIKDADAVIFILRPPRILGRGDSYLLNRVRQYVSLEGNTTSGERIFLVLNATDSIMVDDAASLSNLPRDMQDLMEMLVPGYTSHPLLAKRGGNTPYFLTSAWAAYAAQKCLKGEDLKQEVETYEATKVKLKVQGKDDREVLEASQIPRLSRELSRFTRDRRIEGQINDGRQALDTIVNTLDKKLNKYASIPNRSSVTLKERIDKFLNERQSELKDAVADFSAAQIHDLGNLRQKLEEEAIKACNQTDAELQKKMPFFWKENFISKRTPLPGKTLGKVFFEAFLDEIQLELWRQLNSNLTVLALYLRDECIKRLEEFQVAGRIANASYGYIQVEKLKSDLKVFIIEHPGKTFEAIAERIAVAVMAQPAYFFKAMGDNQQPKQRQLFEVLLKVPAKPIVDASNFKTLLEEVRKLYESSVVRDCVRLLMNLYLYEITLIKDRLFSVIDSVFFELRNNKDSELLERIRGDLDLDEDWERMQLIEKKRQDLEQFK